MLLTKQIKQKNEFKAKFRKIRINFKGMLVPVNIVLTFLLVELNTQA